MPEMVENRGFAFNRGETHPKTVAGVSAAITAGVILKMLTAPGYTAFACMLIAAGGVSNTCERIFQGYVTDYIPMGKKYECNVADIAIFGGVILLMAEESLKYAMEGSWKR